MVSVDSVDSVDTVNSVRINETKVDTTSEAGKIKPPMESYINRRVSSARSEQLSLQNGGKENLGGIASISPSPSASPLTTMSLQPVVKKKPELKAKPKITKVIPVVKSVRSTLIKPNGPVGFNNLPKQLHRSNLTHN